MRVTALIPDDLVADVQQLTQGKNITDALIKALSDWVALQRIKSLNEQISRNPLQFHDEFSAVVIGETKSQIWTLDKKLQSILKSEEKYQI